ncbi:flavin reductase [Ramlibacter sp. AN1015]|uniref:flavin reductase n=1 Tax=Ramlibacter sp. AN1015 TaxID=3133428 RepID=UPI0030C59E85
MKVFEAPVRGPVGGSATSAIPPAVDTRELRRVLGAFVTGVTVITTVDQEGRAFGVTANSFTSVSLDPPLILWNQALKAPSHPAFRDARYFAVNILAEDQVWVSQRFATPRTDKFEGVPVRSGLGGVPLIEGCAAYLECSKEANYPGGDHAIFMGRVESFRHDARQPLVFGNGRYLCAQTNEIGHGRPDLAEEGQAQLHAVRIASRALAELSVQLQGRVALALAVWGSYGPTVVRWEPPHQQQHQPDLRVGVVSRLLTSATGLAFAAHMPREAVAQALDAEWAALPPQAEGVPRTREELDALLAEVRMRSMSRVVASPHFMGTYSTRINAFCAPVFDLRGRILLGLTATGTPDVLPHDWNSAVPAALAATAASLSRQLGHAPEASAPFTQQPGTP